MEYRFQIDGLALALDATAVRTLILSQPEDPVSLTI